MEGRAHLNGVFLLPPDEALRLRGAEAAVVLLAGTAHVPLAVVLVSVRVLFVAQELGGLFGLLAPFQLTGVFAPASPCEQQVLIILGPYKSSRS